MRDAGIRRDAAVAVSGEQIAAVGPLAELEPAFPDATTIDCGGRGLPPGLVDSHTHAIFGRARADEQEQRAAGADYLAIAARGGGIHASVRDLRGRSEAELVGLARGRLLRLASYGTTTVEVKSGYGLSVEDELKTLRGTPGGRRAYLDLLIHEMIPRVVSERLATFADVFCEPGVFTVEETRTILTAARVAGLALKLHADELTGGGGAERG